MITVVGSINLDLIATVERLPAPGETVRSGGYSTAPGGKGANQALAAARAGGKVRMIGAVGKDGFAADALTCLKDGKVQLSGVREAAAATGIALIFVDAKGENVIVVAPGANDTVLPGDLAKAHFAKDEVVLLQHEIPLATIEAALAAAAGAGAVSVLNTAPFRAEAAKLLPMADHVVSNETEFDLYSDALKLSGRDRVARMRAFVERTGRTIIVTLGARRRDRRLARGRSRCPGVEDHACRHGRRRRHFLRLSRRRSRRRAAFGAGAPPRRRGRLARLPEARRATRNPACQGRGRGAGEGLKPAGLDISGPQCIMRLLSGGKNVARTLCRLSRRLHRHHHGAGTDRHADHRVEHAPRRHAPASPTSPALKPESPS